jgi:hypothetical protein
MRRRTLVLVAVLIPGLVVPPVRAQTRTADEAIDVTLGALEEPLRPSLAGAGVIVPGAPIWPPYKQEPPAAQRDFRLVDSPAAPPPGVGAPPAPPATPEPKPGKPPKPCPKPPKPCG